MKNFRCYQMAKSQYHDCQKLKLPRYLKDQLNRASLSICLNLAEGSGKTSRKERRRFYEIALASHRETQAILDIIQHHQLARAADELGGSLFCLIRKLESGG